MAPSNASRLRPFGAACGFALLAAWGAVAAVIGIATGRGVSVLAGVLLVFGVGAVVAASCGFVYASGVAGARSMVPISVVFAVSTILVTLVVSAWIAVNVSSEPYTGNVALLSLLALIYYGIPLLLLGVPTGYLWAALVRRRLRAAM